MDVETQTGPASDFKITFLYILDQLVPLT